MTLQSQAAMHAAEGLRSPSPVVAALVSAGFLTADEAARAQLFDQSRSHTVQRIVIGNDYDFVVKLATSQSRRIGRSLRRECLVYRLAGWCSGVAAAVPSVLAIDEHAELLVLEYLSGAPLSHTIALGGLPAASDLVTLGQRLGSLHAGTSGLALPAAPWPFALQLPDFSAASAQLAFLGPAGVNEAQRIKADALMMASIQRLRMNWRSWSLIHGDLKADNVVAGAGRVAIVDWELAGGGDPAWDVGAFVAELAMAHLTTSVPCTSGAPNSQHVLHPGAIGAVDQFLVGYCSTAGPALIRGGHTGPRVADAVVARFAQVAIEYASGSESPSIAQPYRAEGQRLAALIQPLADYLSGRLVSDGVPQ